MIRSLMILTLSVGSLFAQGEYSLVRVSSPSGAAEVLTVQQPVSNGKNISFVGAYIYSSVAITVTLERNGNAATTTALTPQALNVLYPSAKSNGFHTSNVGTGVTIGSYVVAAGGWLSLDLTGVRITSSGTSQNVTLRTSSLTGNVVLILQYKELN